MIQPPLLLANDPSRPQDEASAGVEVCQPWVWRERNIFRHAALGCIFMPCLMATSIQTHTTIPHSTSPKTPLLPAKQQKINKISSFFDGLWVCHIMCKPHADALSRKPKSQKAWHPKSENDNSHKLSAESSKAFYILNALLICYDNIWKIF